jgi:hypothetical protein
MRLRPQGRTVPHLGQAIDELEALARRVLRALILELRSAREQAAMSPLEEGKNEEANLHGVAPGALGANERDQQEAVRRDSTARARQNEN